LNAISINNSVYDQLQYDPALNNLVKLVSYRVAPTKNLKEYDKEI
jgi:hypothetical protein